MRKIAYLLFFLIINIFVFSNQNEFIKIGNMKIPEHKFLEVKSETIKMKINDNDIDVSVLYDLKNIDTMGVKTTYLFNLDQNIKGKKSTKFIDDIQFYFDRKKVEHTRAIINFDEGNQNVQREWFSYGTDKLKRDVTIRLITKYKLINIRKNKKIEYSFELNNNFDSNQIEELWIDIENNSNKKIEKIMFQDREIVPKGNNYRMGYGKIDLSGSLIIHFK